MKEGKKKPKAQTSLWGELFTPKPAIEDGLLSNQSPPKDEDDELDPFLDDYYEADW